ncbi:MAG: helix-turn-helix domain-containing protein [Faecalibacillus sp.]
MTGERIKKLRKERGLTQQELGQMLGVQKSAIAKYENGRVPNLKKETIAKLAEIFHVTPNYLLGLDDPVTPFHSHNIDIPLYSDVCCGEGMFVEDNIEEYISLPESLLNPRKEYFCQ